MSGHPLSVIILAAGQGTRMKSKKPKVLHEVAGRAMLLHVLDTAAHLGAEKCVVVVGPDMEPVAEAAAPHPTVIQGERLGTGHAVLQAEEALKGLSGDILIMYGDTPLVTAATIEKMRLARDNGASVVVLGFAPKDAGAYGRLISGPDGLERIVEAKDATPEELAVPVCNSGLILADAENLFELLHKVGNDNAKGEYYLTDIVALARAQDLKCAAVLGDDRELLGVNSRADLAVAEAEAQRRLRKEAMDGGATLPDPASVHFSWDTAIGQDVFIGPSTVFGPGVTVADDVEILGHCHIEGAVIEAGAHVGPFARLRPGAQIGPGAKVGNFVEIKNAVIEAGAKVNHLSYVGDARVGEHANLGAGTITANYNGIYKSKTDIGAGASTGSNSVLVAPVTIGDGAIIGAGAVIRADVPADAIAVSGGPQSVNEGAASRYRSLKQAEKDKAGK